MNNKKIMQCVTIAFFLIFIFSVPIITLFTEDKKVSEIENKILTQLPKLSWDNISSKRFMKNFDKYSSDQFPFRSSFIKLKNNYNYLIGQREFRDIYIGKDNRLMVIPTSIEFYKNSLPDFAITSNQKSTLDYINNKVSSYDYLNFYTPYEVLNKNKDKYIYFNTDHHWTQLGAYITYLDMFKYDYDNKKLYDNYTKVSDNFLGTFYSKALLNCIKGDSIYSYSNFNDFKIEIDFDNTYNTLYDKDKLNGKNKYQYFLHGDPAFAIIYGDSSISDEIIVFKDSYAHSFLPFLTNNYGKIHIVDPRYYNIDLEDYLNKNPNINEAMFINNIQSLNSSLYK